jgi:hypothetical protein
MEKAFESKALVEKLKSRGLDVAEEAAKVLVEEVLDWAQASVLMTENKFDDLVAPFIPQVKEAALKAIDKIDGKVGA